VVKVGLAAVALVACGALEAPAPRIDGVEPATMCTAGGQVTVRGDGFTPLAVSTLDGPRLLLPAVTLLGASGEREAATAWRSPSLLEVSIPAGAPPGIAGVRVRNPDGASVERDGALAIVPGPTVASLEPASVCQGVETVTVRGDGFGFAGGAPRVTLDGVEVVADNPGGCADGRCRSFDVPLPAEIAAGPHALAVENLVGSCPGAALAPPLEVLPAPRIVALDADRCVDPELLTVRGSGFEPGTVLRVGGATREATVVDAATIELALAPGDLAAPSSLEVIHPGGCAASLPLAAATSDELRPFFVAPPVLWSGAAVPVTVHLGATPVAVRRVLLRRGGETRELASLQASRPGELSGLAPAGLAAGSYDVAVEADGCSGLLPAGLRVVGDLSLPLARVAPAFATAGVETAITVEAAGAELTETPLLYVAAGGLAVPLRAVTLQSSSAASAVVPALGEGTHDLLAVTPSGRVGLLPGAIVVGLEPAPAVESIAPVSLTTRGGTLAVRGSGFATDAAVTLRCDPPPRELSLAVIARSPTEISATVPAMLAAGTVCVVRVSNGDPALAATPYDELAALAVTNPARNLEPFQPAGTLTVPRRAPAAVAARVTPHARFVYVAGGDDGSRAGAFTTVESAAVDLFGRLGPFAVQRHRMTAARTFAGAARIGGHLYVVGGAGPDGALDTVERSRVLDPGGAPRTAGVQLARGPGPGAGSWVYRVAAVLPIDGETIASEPVNVSAPSGAMVTLRWEPRAGAVGYRVYRTPAAGQPASAAQLLVGVGAETSAVDDGTRAPAPPGPLDVGALGVWHVVDARMTVARQGHAVVASGGRLYAAGGGGTDFAPLHGTYEVAAVAGDTVGAFAAADLDEPRALLAAYVVDRDVKSEVGDAVLVYFIGGGRVTALAPLAVETIDASVAGSIGAGGMLEDLGAVRGTRLAGAGHFAAGGVLFALGGLPAGDGTLKAAICPTPGCASSPPALRSWSAGGRLAAPRGLMATAVESAFVFVLGGVGPAGTLATVERTLW
jgi:hypothetical protein